MRITSTVIYVYLRKKILYVIICYYLLLSVIYHTSFYLSDYILFYVYYYLYDNKCYVYYNIYDTIPVTSI